MIKRLLAAVAVLALGFSQAQAAIVGPLPYTLTNGQPADAAQVMANFNKIMNDVNVNVIFPSFTQQSYYAAATGTANALIVGVSPTPSVYAPGMVINAKIAINNTGPATINVNGLGLQNIVNLNGSALKSQQMVAGMVAQLVYDGVQFQLQSLSPLGARQLTVSRTSALFTAPGAWTFTVPAGVSAVTLEAWGGGGGGGFGAAGPGSGSGGGAGAYAKTNLAVASGDVLSGNAGAAGVGGTAAGVNGTAGGNTTVLLNGVLQVTVGGGSGGSSAAAGVCGAQVNGGNVSGTSSFSVSGQAGSSCPFIVVGTGATGGYGGTAPQGGRGGYGAYNAAGSVGGTPGGAGAGSVAGAAGAAGAAGWVYIEY